MAKPNRLPNFRELYPEADEAVLEVLKKSERKMQYQEYELKAEQTVTDESGRTFTIPGREDSVERMEENGKQFISADDSVEDVIIKREEMERLYAALSQLSKDEQKLIHEIYFENRTERELAQKMGVYRSVVHRKKRRIERKLKNILKNL